MRACRKRPGPSVQAGSLCYLAVTTNRLGASMAISADRSVSCFRGPREALHIGFAPERCLRVGPGMTAAASN